MVIIIPVVVAVVLQERERQERAVSQILKREELAAQAQRHQLAALL